MANVGRPKSEKVCRLNITITEEDKDFLRQKAFERTSGNGIVTISDIIAEYIEADRIGTVKQEETNTDADECFLAIKKQIELYFKKKTK